MGRSPCCSKKGINRGAWTVIEDAILTEHIAAHGEGKWRHLPKKAGLNRCGKSCRLRWLNYLRPDIVRGNISTEEEDLIIRLHKLLGNRWSLIAGRLPGRTDNEIKNYWNTYLRKKLQDRQQKSTTYPDLSNKNESLVTQFAIDVKPEQNRGTDDRWTTSYENGDMPENFMMDLTTDDIELLDLLDFDFSNSCECNHTSSYDNIIDDKNSLSPPPPHLAVPPMSDHQGGIVFTNYEMNDWWTLCDQNVGSNLNSFSPFLDTQKM